MSAVTPAAPSGTSQQAVVEAALVLLERMGLSVADLAAVPQERPAVPTFAEYIPLVSAAVTAGTRRAYGSYWNRLIDHWGGRRLDEPSPSEIRLLMAYVKTHVVVRRNARGGRSAAEHLVAALRCLYRHAEDDGLITEATNPARKVAKPRRLPSTRRAVADTRLAEINEAATATGNDPELDMLLLRLHTETACRRGGALALRPQDLDPDHCLILLREKGETVRWQPVSVSAENLIHVTRPGGIRRSGHRRETCGVPEACLPVSCSDGPTSALGHDDQPCPCACSISCLADSAAGLSCLDARQRPRTRNCSCYAAPISGPAGLGRPRGPRRADPAPAQKAADAPAGHARRELGWDRTGGLHALELLGL